MMRNSFNRAVKIIKTITVLSKIVGNDVKQWAIKLYIKNYNCEKH